MASPENKGVAMLVLTRKIDERITIGDDIELVVVAIDSRGGRVRLGIAAPEDVEIHRKERKEGAGGLSKRRVLHRVRGGKDVGQADTGATGKG